MSISGGLVKKIPFLRLGGGFWVWA